MKVRRGIERKTGLIELLSAGEAALQALHGSSVGVGTDIGTQIHTIMCRGFCCDAVTKTEGRGQEVP